MFQVTSSEKNFQIEYRVFFGRSNQVHLADFKKYETIIFTFVSSNLIKPQRNKITNWFEFKQLRKIKVSKLFLY